MSRVAKNPISLPSGVAVSIANGGVTVKGAKGSLEFQLPAQVDLVQEGDQLKVSAQEKDALALAGTARAIVHNMVVGVSEGYVKKLEINGVGYRAAVAGKKLNLTLGFSHPVDYSIPEGITIECPSQTEVIVSGIDKQKVGQVAADIRAFRPPEPYKGKGVKYADERIIRKEAKKT